MQLRDAFNWCFLWHAMFQQNQQDIKLLPYAIVDKASKPMISVKVSLGEPSPRC